MTQVQVGYGAGIEGPDGLRRLLVSRRIKWSLGVLGLLYIRFESIRLDGTAGSTLRKE